MQAPAAAVVARAVTPEREEALLDDVLGERALSAYPMGERERRAGVTVVYDLKRACVASPHELHQLVVCPLSRMRGRSPVRNARCSEHLRHPYARAPHLDHRRRSAHGAAQRERVHKFCDLK